MILPLENFEGNSKAENYVWQIFKEYLPDNFTSFHNYHIGLKEADVMLLVPNYGVLIIEIKGFLAKNIIDVPDRTIIRVKNNPIVPSPFEQAKKYRFTLLNHTLTPNQIDNVYVTCAVCYPYITQQEYIDTNLNKVSPPELTITKEDFSTSESLLNKIKSIFEHTYDMVGVPSLERYGFDDLLHETVGNLISPDFRNSSPDVTDSEYHEVKPLKRNHYSKLIYINKSENCDNESIDAMIREWSSGTEIYFYTSDSSLLSTVISKLNEELVAKELNDNEAFKIKSNKTFLFNGGLIESSLNDFQIINGENYGDFRQELEVLDKESTFNLHQYEIEHAALEHLIIKAGAGTGKTYSMISRINYLIWKKDYSAEELKIAIAMVTFTNESADAMKEKLSANFLKYYQLTKDIEFLAYIESVEDMNISTIHSLAKVILQKFSSQLGLGKNFSIITGEYKREQLLHKNLNDYIKEHPEYKDLDISMFYLGKRLRSFMEKLDNKNVDVVNDIENLNFGKNTIGEFDGFIDVIRKTQIEMNQYCQENNYVCLGDIIRKLKQLHTQLKANGIQIQTKIDFLFVDEFQDTDDVQISLICLFKELFGFKIFAVGDIKQCIYRFRGAEVKAFDILIDELGEQVKDLSLNKNYRTDALLMNKLNRIFSKWNENKDIEYGKKDELIPTKKIATELEFKIEDYNSKQKDNFGNTLIKAIEEGMVSLKDDEKIAILVRYNWQISEIKTLCEKHGIYVETEVGGELFRIDPTIDLYKLVLALKYNKSSEHLFNLYTTSFIKEDMEKISVWSKASDEVVGYFYDNLPASIPKWNEYIERLRTEPVLKVIRDIVDDVKPWEIFAHKTALKDEDVQRSESYYMRNLDQLFEKLISAANTDYLTINKLSDFLEIMILTRREEEARESYDIDKTSAKVLCTTVHKSKGLEFDTVFLPYCEFNIASEKLKGDVDLIYSKNEVGYRIKGKENGSVTFENDLYSKFQKNEIKDRKHEETRILYVALTRAKRKVYIMADSYKSWKVSNWKKMIKVDEK